MRKALSKLLKLDHIRSRSASASRDSSRPPAEGEQRSTQSPEPAPEAQAEAVSSSLVEAPSDNVSEKLWSLAYELLAKREPELIQDYELHISSRQADDHESSTDAARLSALSNPESVTKVVQALQDERESRRWKFTVKGKSHKAKDQLEKLVKLLSIADSVVKQAVSTQPYAALAWSAVSVFLPVCNSRE